MNPDGTVDLLTQLRDIHAAPPVPFWPPAPGWWIVAVLLLLLLAWCVRLLRRRWQAGRRRKLLVVQLAELKTMHDPAREPQAWLSAVNRLLKVTAMQAFPEQAPGVLQGEAWAAFLGGDGGPDAFTALAAGPYQPSPAFDATALEGAATAWIQRHG